MKGLLTAFLIFLMTLVEAIEYKKIENGKEVAVASIEAYAYVLLFIATIIGFYFINKKNKL